DVLHVLGADMAGAHHLLRGLAGSGLPKQLHEQHQPGDLAVDGARAGGQHLEVVGADLAEPQQAGWELAGGARSRLVCGSERTMLGGLDVFVDAPGSTVTGDLLRLQENEYSLVGGADEHRLPDELGRDRIEVTVEADAEALTDDSAVDIVGVE